MNIPPLTWAVLGYLVGSIPFGYVLTRLFSGEDIRESGSGNVGATNVSRKLGLAGGIATAALDIGKGSLAAALALHFTHHPYWTALAGLSAVLGHCYPVFLKFQGGKAVATFLGVFAVLSPWVTLAGLGLFIGVTAISGYVSLGSMVLAAAFPVLLYVFNQAEAYILAASCIALLIVWRHRKNIKRLLDGTERTFTLRRRK